MFPWIWPYNVLFFFFGQQCVFFFNWNGPLDHPFRPNRKLPLFEGQTKCLANPSIHVSVFIDVIERSSLCHVSMFSYTTPFHFTDSLSLSLVSAICCFVSVPRKCWHASPQIVSTRSVRFSVRFRFGFPFHFPHTLTSVYYLFIYFIYLFSLFTAIEGFLNRSELCKYPSFVFRFSFLSFFSISCLLLLIVSIFFEWGCSTLTLRTTTPTFRGNSPMPTEKR